jgi:hypothetical protein
MPDASFPTIDINKAAAELNKVLKEGAYTAIGLGVMGFQRAQVHRVELTRQLEAQRRALGTLPNNLNSQVDGYAQSARSKAEATRTQLAEQLSGLGSRFDGVLAPARAQLAKTLGEDLPTLPDLTRQVADLTQQLAEANQMVEAQIGVARGQLGDLVKAVDSRVQPTRKQFDEQLDRLEERLPSGARDMLQSVRAAAVGPEYRLRHSVGLD